ncbi:hypothetical protein D3C80_1859830 [compost metagenome]
MGFYLNLRINLLQPDLGRLGFGSAQTGILFRVELLALKITPLHIIPVSQNQPPHTAAGQSLCDAGSQRTCTYN